MVGVSAAVPLTREDLVSAWIDFRRYADKHPDLRDFHRRRYSAMATAFGVDLEAPPQQRAPDPPWLLDDLSELQTTHPLPRHTTPLVRLLNRTVEYLLASGSPFDGYLEAPPDIAVLYQRRGHGFFEAHDMRRRACRALLLDLVELIWGLGTEAVVDRSAVRVAGFDPDERAPEPEDYL
ncbi:MAG: hypothetical protein AB7I38_17470 [Dehalococcoidia bacterium]